MKKILIVAAFFISTGILSSCTKENNVAPAGISQKLAGNEADSGDHTATGDGGVDRPPVVKRP